MDLTGQQLLVVLVFVAAPGLASWWEAGRIVGSADRVRGDVNRHTVVMVMILAPLWGCGLPALAYERWRWRNRAIGPGRPAVVAVVAVPVRWLVAWPRSVGDAVATARAVSDLHARAGSPGGRPVPRIGSSLGGSSLGASSSAGSSAV